MLFDFTAIRSILRSSRSRYSVAPARGRPHASETRASTLGTSYRDASARSRQAAHRTHPCTHNSEPRPSSGRAR
eukprot:2253885-Prymnesium_polylepis.1